MTDYANKVAEAGSPQEALFIIAVALEDLHLKFDALVEAEPEPGLEPDPWAQWCSPALAVEVLDFNDSAEVLTPDNANAIEQLQQKLDATSDGEERSALEAQLRLLKDDGRPGYTPDEGHRATETEEEVNIPPANADRRNARREWIRGRDIGGFLESGLDVKTLREAYAVGGPTWLYNYDRDAVTQLPLDWRRAMIEDLALDSQAAAHEMARDILKADFNDVVAGGTAIAEDAR